VSVRETFTASHSGHGCSSFISSSMSATRLRPTRPYRGPKRPALRVTRPALRSSGIYDESAGRKIKPVILKPVGRPDAPRMTQGVKLSRTRTLLLT
jgi:hypothetical protein